MTYGEEFDLALACNTQEEADEFVRTNIAHRVKDFGQTPEEAEKVLKANLGYICKIALLPVYHIVYMHSYY